MANRGKVRDPLTGSVLKVGTLPPANQLPQNSGYSPIDYQQPSNNPAFNVGVRNSILPPGQMIQAALISEVRFLQSSGTQQSQTPVLAQVQGNVRVDGQVVIPSGALLLGTVIASDPGLGRIRIEIQSVQFGTTTIPVHGAYAWTVYGDNSQTATLAEGIPAEATGTPNYTASDLQSAAGSAFSTFARTLGQQVTYGSTSSFGTPYSSSYSQGDVSTSAQRAISQGASDFLTRQVRRTDQATVQQTA